jgi:hypothetical protein
MIAASSGDYDAMHSLLGAFKGGARDKYISHEWLRPLGAVSKDSTFAAFKFLCQDEE